MTQFMLSRNLAALLFALALPLAAQMTSDRSFAARGGLRFYYHGRVIGAHGCSDR